TPRGRAWQIDVATIFLAFAFPAVIMHVSWTELSQNCERPLARGWRLALWPAYALSFALPTAAIVIAFSPRTTSLHPVVGQAIGVGLSAAFIGAAAYCIALLSHRKRPTGLRDRQSRRSILILFALMIAVFVLLLLVTSFTGNRGPMAAAGDVVVVIAKS